MLRLLLTQISKLKKSVSDTEDSIAENPLFGAVRHVRKTVTTSGTLDEVLDSIPIDPANPTIGVDVSATISDAGNVNHSYVIAWRNSSNKYCWALIMNFAGIYYALRLGTDTYTITKIG